jgi:hypothetical protein
MFSIVQLNFTLLKSILSNGKAPNGIMSKYESSPIGVKIIVSGLTKFSKIFSLNNINNNINKKELKLNILNNNKEFVKSPRVLPLNLQMTFY